MRKRPQCEGGFAPVSPSMAKVLFACVVAASALTTPATASWASHWSNGVSEASSQSALQYSGATTESTPKSQDHEFSLRHVLVHGLHEQPDLYIRRDFDPSADVRILGDEAGDISYRGPFHAKSKNTVIQRLSDRRVSRMQSLYEEARYTGSAANLDHSSWTLDQVSAPNVTDQDTVVNLAKLSWCAYTEVPGTGEWPDTGERFNETARFGWKGDNLRGHVFADKDNSTVIISLKGTSPAFWDGAETTTNDKINDNLFFGCCCGEGGQFLWRHACSCKTSTYTCNSTCVVQALKQENRYYSASLELFGNVTDMYPNSTIWLLGHSLGGATSALLGLTFGVPTVTFEAPGDALAATRLGLPAPPGSFPGAPQTRENTGAVHFGHTADPIFMGTCNAATSACTLGGYAMQTQCHTGTVCRYDTVADKGWRVGIGYHKIKTVIDDVLLAYDAPPPCFPDDECVDCFNWKYFESNGSETTTTTSSSTSTSPLTRTTTCQTPGWWGCLDETTTTSTTSSSTAIGPVTSCLKYGWFGGCLETTTITPTSTSTSLTTSTVTATSCAEYGWFGGCLENGTTTYTTTKTVETPPEMWTTSCAVYGWFWGCARTTTIPLLPITKTPDALTTSCLKHGWWGWGACVSSTTLYRTPSAGLAAPVPVVPTITTTRPITTKAEARTIKTATATATAKPSVYPDL